MSTLEKGFLLEGLRVMPPTGEVAGPGGVAKLDPKVMAVLVLMAENAGQVMLRDDLVARLWPHAVVGDDALTRCFYELRRQLAHAGGSERYRGLFETLPKRGYRLNGTVRPGVTPSAAISAPAPIPRRRGPAIAAAAVGLIVIAAAAVFYWKSPGPGTNSSAVTKMYSIAVLPFLDMSAAKDQGYLSDGVTEEILNRLSQADNLRVIARTSSFSMRDQALDVPEIAARLGVEYVLEGSVRRSGEQMRITAQLIDVSTNAHVWSRTYDRKIEDLFAVQDEIAASVAAELQVSLSGQDTAERPPISVEAHERFLQGEMHYNRRSPGDIERAIQYYKQAVALDPGYARAWAALAGGYSLLYSEVNRNDPALRNLQGEAARKAVELNPHLAVAHARLAQYYFQVQQRAQGAVHLNKATALDPDDPLVLGFKSSDAVWRGDIEEAVQIWRKLVARDPLSAVSRGNLSYMLYASGQLEQSLAEARRALELNPGEQDHAVDISRNLILLERYDEALESTALLTPGKDRDYVISLLHRAPGRRAEADAALKSLAAGTLDTIDVVHLAEVHAFRGRIDEAFNVLLDYEEQLERNRKQNPLELRNFQDEIRMAWLLKPLHADPRWADLTALPAET